MLRVGIRGGTQIVGSSSLQPNDIALHPTQQPTSETFFMFNTMNNLMA